MPKNSAPTKTSASDPTIKAALVILTILLIITYLIVRFTLFVISPHLWYEKVVALFLLCAESFLLIHGIGYFLNVLNVLKHSAKSKTDRLFSAPLTTFPPVAIVVSSYHEPLEVVAETLTCFYNLTYPNKHLYFLDDTRYDLPGQDARALAVYREAIDRMCRNIGVNLFRRRWHGAKAGMINDFLAFRQGHPPEGFLFWPFEEGYAEEQERYIIVFDADMNPFPDFVEHLVAAMESDPRLAFIQTPQYYSNFEYNRVARAAGLQQAVFYEYICEGKSAQEAMFCCGTNVIFRMAALIDVGGFDDTSVTEDFATSLKFHSQKWSSAYLNRICAFGMGPEDLGGYFKQQFRWALGTVGLFRTIVGKFIRNPRQLSLAKWWEYFLSGTHYFVGWVFFVLVVCPVLYLFFGTPSYFARPDVYFLLFTPYLILSLSMFFGLLGERGYRYKDLFQGVLLNAISFPVFMKASLLGIVGSRGTFGITPKGGSRVLPLSGLIPQIAAAVVCFAAVIWGMHRLYYERHPAAALVFNSLWCLYHFIILAATLYFNHPHEKG